MSLLNVNEIQHSSGAGSNIALDNQGNVECAANVQMASLNGNQLAGVRSPVVNGNFLVWQRGVGPHQSTVSFNYGPDGWRNFSNANNQLTQISGTDCPNGFDYGCRVNNTSGTYLNNLGLTQGIELQDLGGKGEPFTKGSTWTFSCISTATSLNLDVFFGEDTQTSTDSVVANQECTQVGVYEGSWFIYEYEITFPNSDPDAAAQCLAIRPRTNGQSSWDITGIQLEPGRRTPFENISIALTWSICQRYFYKTTSRINASKNCTNASPATDSQGFVNVFYPTIMRVAPDVDPATISLNVANSPIVAQRGTNCLMVFMTSTTTNASNSCGLNAGLEMSAEL